MNEQKVEKWKGQVDGILAEIEIQIDKKKYPSEVIPLMEILKGLKDMKRNLSVLQVIIKNKGGEINDKN